MEGKRKREREGVWERERENAPGVQALQSCNLSKLVLAVND